MKYFYLITICFFISFNFCFAQNTQINIPINNSQTIPRVVIENISLDKEIYNSGETVTGKIKFLNIGDSNQSDIYYAISLAGDFSTSTNAWNIPNIIYDTKTFGPLIIKSGESSEINFSYNLPDGISGEGLGLRVLTQLQTGLPISWNNAFFKKIEGQDIPLEVKQNYISVDGQDFSSQSGPTIYPNNNAEIKIKLYNPTDKEIIVSPYIEIFDRFISDNILKTIQKEFLKIPAKSEKDLIIPVDKNLEPKVYLSRISLYDLNKKLRAPKLQTRYIIGGKPIATIQTVYTNDTSLTKNKPLNLSVSYSGSPRDLNTGQDLKIGEAVLNVKLFNEENNELIGENSITKSDFDVDFGTVDIQVVPKKYAQKIRVEAFIIKDQNILGKYNTSINLPEKKSDFLFSYIDFVIISILLLGFISLFIFRKKINTKLFFCISLILIIATIIFVLIKDDLVFAQPYVQINNPIGQDVLRGSDINITGVIVDLRCLNAIGQVYATSTIIGVPGTTNTVSYIHQNVNQHFQFATDYNYFSFLQNTQNLEEKRYTVQVEFSSVQTGIFNNSVSWINKCNSTDGLCRYTYWTSSDPVPAPYGYLSKATSTFNILFPSEGYLDGVNGSCAAWGWVCDKSNYASSTQVHFYVDSDSFQNYAGYTTANINRPDLVSAGVCGGYANHGYSFDIPAQYKDGQTHNLYAYGINIGKDSSSVFLNSMLIGSPKQFNCPAPQSGVCGSAASVYASSSVSFNGAYCGLGQNPVVTPNFPDKGQASQWTCSGVNGGSATTCTASRCSDYQSLENGVCISSTQGVSQIDARLSPNIVNYGEYCTVNISTPGINIADVNGVCGLFKNNIKQVDQDLLTPGFQVQGGSVYRVLCQDGGQLLATSKDLNCLINPKTKEL